MERTKFLKSLQSQTSTPGVEIAMRVLQVLAGIKPQEIKK